METQVTTMKALYAEAPKQAVLRTDYPIPALKAKGVRVKVKLSFVAARFQAVLAGTSRCTLADKQQANSSFKANFLHLCLHSRLFLEVDPLALSMRSGPKLFLISRRENWSYVLITMVPLAASFVFFLKLIHLIPKGKMPHGILQGFCHWGTEQGRQLQAQWRDGSFAEYAMIPAENVIPVRGEFMKTLPLEQLAKINYLAISYGALKAGELKAGNVVVVAGWVFCLAMAIC